MLVQAKAWYTSKLMWLGILEIVAGSAELVMDGIQSGEGWVAIGAGVVTIIFRAVTKKPVATSSTKQKSVV